MTARRSADLSAPPPAGFEPPDTGGTFATARVLALGEAFSGSVTGGSDVTDMFRVTSPQEGVLAVTLAGLTGPVLIQVYSSGGQFLGSASGGGSGSLSLARLVAAGADYFVAIRAGSAAVLPYQLVVGYSPYSGTADGDTLGGSRQGDMMAGLAGDDSLLGYQGDDTIYGGDGNDSLSGGAGNDLLVGGNGQDQLAGGGANDTLYAGHDGATLLGGAGDDWLYGGSGPDLIRGGAGHDWITGSEGNDSLYGGQDADFLYGTFGDDLIFGGTGHDTLQGDAGADTCDGGADDDLIEGGAGRDRLSGGGGNDLVIGGGGADTIYGGAGDDRLLAGDSLRADTATDVLYGGAGADSLYGSEGRDIFDLGAGDGAADRVVIWTFQDGGLGSLSDRIDGFERGLDRMDFQVLDADPVAGGRQALAWGDTTATARGLWWQADGADVLLWLDRDGDALADAVWRLTGQTALSQDDLIL